MGGQDAEDTITDVDGSDCATHSPQHKMHILDTLQLSVLVWSGGCLSSAKTLTFICHLLSAILIFLSLKLTERKEQSLIGGDGARSYR